MLQDLQEVVIVEILLDADVYCDDGLGGRSTYIISDPNRKRVTHLVVTEISSQHSMRLVPVNRMVSVRPVPIRLLCRRYELAQMRPFITSELIETATPRYVSSGTMSVVTNRIHEHKWVQVKLRATPPGELPLSGGVRVMATDGFVGTVAGFIVDDRTGLINKLVLHRELHWGGRDVLISVSHLKKIKEDKICLSMNAQNIAVLPAVPAKR
jgi:hypothetical protein